MFAKADSLPLTLKPVITRVHDAAVRKDFATLRSLMIDEFTWSFGGDGSAGQAIAEWKSDPSYLRSLAFVTKQTCGFVAPNIVQCPKKAGTGFRAGFVREGDEWKFIYFVAGD